ncbi:hypothetical protein OSB04_022632 [Centaurea solstitialis]|uniref:Uncharacterized protein n=1 Tax=Centaurea solstitialis TaxID=347529 RepID=A0AA38SY52_9ASTR|nr:hypothetical protein OSB04_022632 [Centaurea solstitialis]
MAEIFVAAFVNVLFEKLASADFMKLARSEGIESQLNKWKKTLSQIQAVLADAEQKQIKERHVELWLQDLQDLAYDIDDVLDDLATEAMRREFNQEAYASSSTSKVLKFIPTCCVNSTPRNIMYGRKMSSKLDEITAKLHNLVEQKNSLGLQVNVNVERSNRIYKRLEETSLVDESKVMGREGDKEALLEKLLGKEACNQDVRVVSIVGLGGIGKTTLARVLYNHEKVKEHFELMAWVCVSEEFDVFNISKVIFQAVAGNNQDFADLNLLHVALKEKLSKKRFLVVLDDVWNENYMELELLQRPFVEGAPGSKIIVTTRKTAVASMMKSSQSYNLDVLSEEEALSLFARHALDEDNFDKYASLKGHGEGIVKKCGRLPLALITLGTMLWEKRDDHEKWEEVLNSEIWDLPNENQILPALRLSYYDLPSHLKQLFAYCSLFPKDYMFDKNKLVLLWMAQGFLKQTNSKKSKESLGLQYFEELKSRSFFQVVPATIFRRSGYIMHDLINDLATSVAGGFCFRLDDKKDKNNEKDSFERFRHVSFIGEEYGTYRKFKELEGAVGLRTFLPLSLSSWPSFYLSNNDLAELLPQLRFIRVLSLSRHHSITELPQSTGTLKHIRYLNVSWTNIESLPQEVGDLYNLQSLLLRHCHMLSSLPFSFVKLIKLQHLDIYDTPQLSKMPLGIGGLTNLQTLSKIIIEGSDGFKISEMKDLSSLKGQVSISGLDKVIDPTQAEDAKLQQKEGIDDLTIEWSNEFDDSRNQVTEYEVLNSLRPPPKLKKLGILFFGGTIFPSWVGEPSFNQLTELKLHGCKRCTDLPPLGHLGSLKKLFVDGMDGVKTFSLELPGRTDSFHGTAFPLLEVLGFSNMQGWERWSTRLGDNNDGTSRSFPFLREVYVKNCPKLVEISIDLMPSLVDLYLKGCSEEVFESMVGASSSIRTLTLKDISCGSLENYRCPNSVESLDISSCDSLTSLTLSTIHELPSSIKTLLVSDCDNLESIAENGFGTISLEHVRITNCKNLKSFPHEHLESLTSLECLTIINCPSMDDSFPCGLWPPNLRKLLMGCLKKPMSEWGGVVSFVGNAKDVTSSSFLLPPSLKLLEIRDFMDVESVSEVLQHLPCLKTLNILSCPKLKDLPEIDSTDPSSLKIFEPSHALTGIPQSGPAMPLTPLDEACFRMDLTVIHEIVEDLAYKDDEGAATEFIDVGTMVSPTVYARPKFVASHLMSDMPQEALDDACRSSTSHLQALFALGRENEAQIALKEGLVLEEKRTSILRSFLKKSLKSLMTSVKK